MRMGGSSLHTTQLNGLNVIGIIRRTTSNYETISVSDNPNERRTNEGGGGGRRESEIDRLRFPQTIPAGAAGHTDGAGFVY